MSVTPTRQTAASSFTLHSMTSEKTPPPQQGVHIDFEKAADIIKRATGKTLQAYKESGLGYNNRIYYCQVENEETYVLKVAYAKPYF